jgi:hypothetical protein
VQHTFLLDNIGCEDLGSLEFEGSISSYWGVNMRAEFDGIYKDCKVAGRVVQRRNFSDWTHDLRWHPHASSPWGEYLQVFQGPAWNNEWPMAGAQYYGTWTPEGEILCGAGWNTGLAFKSGYSQRNWKYDDRLKYDQPPHFITPLNSDGRWVAGRRTEQVPTPVAPPS